MHRFFTPRFRTVSILAIALIPLVVIWLIWASGNDAAADAQHWTYAARSAPKALMPQVVADHLTPDLPVDAGRMKVWKIQLTGQKRPLYLIDSRIASLARYPHANPLCGASACAFFGYIPVDQGKFQEIWNAYLNVNLPPGVSLFEEPDELKNQMPVLKINQMQGDRIEQRHLSFNGQAYEITETLLTPQTYD